MVLLFQQNFQEHKLVRQELTKVYGINKFLAHQICDSLGFALTLKVQDLTASQKEKLVRLVQRYYVTGSDLKRIVDQDIQRCVTVGSFKGFRFIQGLPVRGQRSHTNARSCRKKKIV